MYIVNIHIYIYNDRCINIVDTTNTIANNHRLWGSLRPFPLKYISNWIQPRIHDLTIQEPEIY